MPVSATLFNAREKLRATLKVTVLQRALRGGVERERTFRRGRQKRQSQIEAEISEMKRAIRLYSRGIIHPRNTWWIGHWDIASFALLIYTAIVTPFEVCVLRTMPLDALHTNPGQTTIFIINRVVDIFFLMDMVLNFFLAYREPAYSGGRWITSRTRIAWHYIQTWFFFDIISVVPFDLITRAPLRSPMPTSRPQSDPVLCPARRPYAQARAAPHLSTRPRRTCSTLSTHPRRRRTPPCCASREPYASSA
jgi:hypothetical protein